MFPDQKSKKNKWLTYLIIIIIILVLFFWIKSFFAQEKTVVNSNNSSADEQNYDTVSDLTNLPAKDDDSFDVGSQSGATYPGNSLAVTNQASTSTSSPIFTDGAASCTEFVYTDWTSCLNGVQTRSIKSSSPAGCVGGNPVYAQNCGLSIVNTNICSSFTYSNWGSCSNGVQYRSVTGSLPVNCTGGNPITSQSCNSNNNNNNTTKTCTSFTYSTWGTCSGGVQTRSIVSSSPSNCSGGSPLLSQSCGTNNCTSFTYSAWSSCVNGSQTRSVQSSTPTGCTGGTPVVSQACVAATTTLSFYKKLDPFTVSADKVIDLEKVVKIGNLSFKWGDDMGSCLGTVKISKEQSGSGTAVLTDANVITPSQHNLNDPGEGRYITFSKDASCGSYYVTEGTITGKYDAPLTSASSTGN